MSKDKDLRDKELELDIQLQMATKNGRRFVWRILEYCGVYQDMDFQDALHAAKQAGRRQVGLYLLGICSEKEEQNVFKMMQEAKQIALEEDSKYVTKERLDRKSDDGKPKITDDRGREIDEYPFGLPDGDPFVGGQSAADSWI